MKNDWAFSCSIPMRMSEPIHSLEWGTSNDKRWEVKKINNKDNVISQVIQRKIRNKARPIRPIIIIIIMTWCRKKEERKRREKKDIHENKRKFHLNDILARMVFCKYWNQAMKSM